MSLEILHRAVQDAIVTYTLAAQAIPCDPDLADTAAFCEHYGYSPSQSANTIIVASRLDPAQSVACLVLATTRLDVNKKVRTLTGIRKLSFASAEQTTALTDMLIGGVTIVGLPKHVPIYIDQAVMEQAEIILGGGNRSSKIVINPNELLKLPNVEIIPELALAR